MIDGSNEKYENFFKKTGYGEMLGLKGINCYHGFRAFFEWEDIPKEVDKEENKKKYELFQKQRAYERKIRRLKREREVYKEFDEDKYKEVNTSLQSTYKEFDKFIDDNNLKRDYSRELSITKTNSGKITNYSKKEIQAFNDYISPKSITLNEKLRKKEKLTNEEKEWVKNLDSALDKTDNYEGNIVRSLIVENLEEYKKQFVIDNEYSTNQYLSFSTKETYHENPNVKIYIENSKKSKDLIKINTIGENETLYKRNQKFKILNVVEKNGIIYMVWEEK